MSSSVPWLYVLVRLNSGVAASALAGIGVGFFGCLLSSADKQRQLNGGKHTDRSRIRFILGAIGSTIFGVMSLVGLAFGPVALVVVVRAGATLPANAFFSQASDLSAEISIYIIDFFLTNIYIYIKVTI